MSGTVYHTSTITYLAQNLQSGQRSVAPCSIRGVGQKDLVPRDPKARKSALINDLRHNEARAG